MVAPPFELPIKLPGALPNKGVPSWPVSFARSWIVLEWTSYKALLIGGGS